MYTTNVRYTNLSPKGNMNKLSNKKRVDCLATVVKVLVVLWKSGVGSERLYNSKKEWLRVFVVLGGIGIDYEWMVKRVNI
jgi:hypothetical protein